MNRRTRRSRRSTRGFALPLVVATLAASACDRGPVVVTEGDWPVITGNLAGQRYSALDQVNASNFEDLEVAWHWDVSGGEFGQVLARPTPVYVDGKLITVAGERRSVVALNAGTGELLWSYTEPETFRWEYSMRKNHGKGVAYANVDGRDIVYLVSPAFFLHALDANTGEHIEGFGGAVPVEGFPETGVVDLLADLGHEYDPYSGVPLEKGYITSSSPAIVVNGVVVVGNSAEQGYNQTRQEMIPGDILAYDARSGDFRWKFDVLPEEGEYGNNEELDTWLNDAWEWTGDISSWAPLSADPELGLVYIPTNGATADFWGGFRPGDNLFSTSLIALDVQTGERAWHYQLVHHDIWNYDTPTVPVLVDVNLDGQPTPAVVQVTKQAFAYAFNRATGEPLWPIEERPVPEALIPGEQLSPTQPFPTKPAAYDMQGLSEDDLIDYTPELRQQALDILDDFVWGPLFTPPLHRDNDLGKRAAVWCPGDTGGTNIDGTPAGDPTTGILYVPSHKACSSRVMIPGAEADNPDELPTGTTINAYAVGRGGGPGSVGGLPLWKPPYSRITAIDMNTGEHLWWIPAGETPDRYRNNPAVEGIDIGDTGNGSLVALFVTPELLIYASSASDGTPRLFAVDKSTGEQVGTVDLPSSARYGMMTYMHDGKQYVVTQINGGLVALALPSVPGA